MTTPVRMCPACGAYNREELYKYRLTSGTEQIIYACDECSMIYAQVTKLVDYTNSIYEIPGALGSGVSAADKSRLQATARKLNTHFFNDKRVLDVGCAQGGMLDALHAQGFTNITGLDPSQVCVDACRRKGHRAIVGSLADLHSSYNSKYDLIIMSHVLEHIYDIQNALRIAKKLLTPDGSIYIEVPDASQYHSVASYLPFLDFNDEHINHFTPDTLTKVLCKCGLKPRSYVDKKMIPLNNGSTVPAMWVLAGRNTDVRAVMLYIDTSELAIAKSCDKIANALQDKPEVAIWGAGEYLSHVLPVIGKKIVAIVDRNSALHGKPIQDLQVASPDKLLHIDPSIPIVVAALVASSRIEADIKTMGLKNPIITLN